MIEYTVYYNHSQLEIILIFFLYQQQKCQSQELKLLKSKTRRDKNM